MLFADRYIWLPEIIHRSESAANIIHDIAFVRKRDREREIRAHKNSAPEEYRRSGREKAEIV